MKVCFITPYFYPVEGGVENHVLWVARGLIEQGYVVEVWTSDGTRGGRSAMREELIGNIRVRRFRTLFQIGKFTPFFPGVFLAVLKSDADVFHVQNYRHPTNLLALFTKKPCVLTPHWPDYPKGLRRSWLDNIMIPLFDRTIGRWLLRRFRKMCVVAKGERAWLVQRFGVNEEKIVLTPNGLPEDFFKPLGQAMARRVLRLKSGRKMVLAVGRLHASKGFDRIVRVAKLFPDVDFVIVGPDDGFKKQLEACIAQEEVLNVRLQGRVSEEKKKQWYSAADVFVHPSHYEAFGISVLEAMARKCPVLVAKKGGLPWVVGNAGLVFADEKEFVRKLRRILERKALRKELGLRGLKRARKFVWSVTVERLDALYQEVQS